MNREIFYYGPPLFRNSLDSNLGKRNFAIILGFGDKKI